MSKNLVVKDNNLINASYNLELVEQRILLMAVVQSRHLGNSINEFFPVIIHAQDYADRFNLNINSAYRALRDASKTLFNRKFTYSELSKKGNTVHVENRWVTQVRYTEMEGEITLMFSPVVIPLITELEKQFTCYEIEQIACLSSAHAVRIYELLMSWKTVLEVQISLEDLKFKLGLEEYSYPRVYDFKKRVLTPSVQQISKETDIKVSVQDIKKGRSVKGFVFKFSFENKSNNNGMSHEKLSIDEWIQKNNLAHIGESWEEAKKRLKDQYNEYRNQ
ncbi:MAG: replication initiation protein RepM [Magnetovibrio sp.]|nr:replication initiation protein RepM [Magnetovibrio sp.]